MSNLTQDMGKYSCLFANILIPLCPEIQIEFNKITRANLTNGQLRVSRARPGSVGAGCRALWPRHVCHTLSRPRIPDTATYQTRRETEMLHSLCGLASKESTCNTENHDIATLMLTLGGDFHLDA